MASLCPGPAESLDFAPSSTSLIVYYVEFDKASGCHRTRSRHERQLSRRCIGRQAQEAEAHQATCRSGHQSQFPSPPCSVAKAHVTTSSDRCGIFADSAAAAAAPSGQTEEQRLKEQKRVAKALRKQQWEAQQAALANEGGDAGGAGEGLDGAPNANGAAEPSDPETAPQKKSRKSASNVVRH